MQIYLICFQQQKRKDCFFTDTHFHTSPFFLSFTPNKKTTTFAVNQNLEVYAYKRL